MRHARACSYVESCRSSQGNLSLPMCEYAPSPFSEFWTRLTVRLDLCARLFSMPTALALPLYAYALTRIVGYPRHEVRNEDRLPRAAFDLLAVALAQRGT